MQVTGSGRVREEEVLTVLRSDLVAGGVLGQGFTHEGLGRCLEIVVAKSRLVPRSAAEEDPTLKQIIPYGVVTFEGRIFLFRRTERGGEARLHGKFSIGVGGHVTQEGVSRDRIVEGGLRRELEEELVFDQPYRFEPLGLINDDTVPVGRVHLGIVYLVAAQSDGVRVREEETMVGGFVSVQDLTPRLGGMESWSRIVAESVFLGDPGRAPRRSP